MKPILSAVGLLATGSLIYLFKTYTADKQNIIEKEELKQILIILRKRFFSTLRQIAFIVNNIKANQTEFQPQKISNIIMKDGGSGDTKLNLIQSITLNQQNLTKQSFQASCDFYKNDYEIRLLLRSLTMDIELALNGNIQSYNGPLINLSSKKVIHIYREILKRRMENIKAKFIHQVSNQQILKNQFLMYNYILYHLREEFLKIQGIRHEKQSNQKIFISILELKYQHDSQFRIDFEKLQIQMHDFVKEIQKKHQQKLQKIEKKNQQKKNI